MTDLKNWVESPRYADLYRKLMLIAPIFPALYFNSVEHYPGGFLSVLWPIYFFNIHRSTGEIGDHGIYAILYGWPLLVLMLLVLQNYNRFQTDQSKIYTFNIYSWIVLLVQFYIYTLSTLPNGTVTLLLPLPLILILLINIPITISLLGKISEA